MRIEGGSFLDKAGYESATSVMLIPAPPRALTSAAGNGSYAVSTAPVCILGTGVGAEAAAEFNAWAGTAGGAAGAPALCLLRCPPAEPQCDSIGARHTGHVLL